MPSNGGQTGESKFVMDKNNLYREESLTDLKVANIQRFVPVHLDGTPDRSRDSLFFGRTNLNTPDGPMPIQANLPAKTLEQAIDIFPQVMEAQARQVVEKFKQREEQRKNTGAPKIVVPGRTF
jgi:hypothetical protein